MKKLFVVLMMMVYGLSSSGMTVNLHYCCGKLDDVSLAGQHSQGCEMAAVKKNSKCCHDQQVTVKLQTDQQQAIKWFQSNNSLIALPASSTHHISITEQLAETKRLARGVPVPIRAGIPIYLFNCIFRV